MERPRDQCGRATRFLRIHPKRMPMTWPPDCSNEQPDDPVVEFRAESPVAILRAIPQTDGSCSAVASKAREYGSTVLASTLGEWIQESRDSSRTSLIAAPRRRCAGLGLGNQREGPEPAPHASGCPDHHGLPHRRHGTMTSRARWYSLQATCAAPQLRQIPRRRARWLRFARTHGKTARLVVEWPRSGPRAELKEA